MSISFASPESDARFAPLTPGAAKALVRKLITKAGKERFSAKSVLNLHPPLEDHPSCVLDLAYEEYCRNREAGLQPVPAEFVQDFSQIQQSLCRLIELDQAIRENPELVQEYPEDRWPRRRR